jgi:hypothetical protein
MANTLKFGNGEWYGKKDTILAYNDENSNYKPLPFNFSREGSATVVNKEGLIETVGSGQPRIDYKDDVKGALLLEPQRTNLIPYSEYISSWSTTGAVVTENYAISPEGVLNATRLVGTGNDFIRQDNIIANPSNKTFTSSFWAKNNGGDANISVQMNSSGVSTYAKGIVLTNEWQRFDFTQSYAGTDTGSLTFRFRQTNSIDCLVYGFQLEEGSYATSYIPTSGSAVTRLADSCSQTVPDGVIGQTEGTLFVETTKWVQSNNGRILSVSDGTLSNYITIIQNTTFLNYGVYIQSGGVTQVAYTETQAIPDNSKIAISYKQNDFTISVNGQIVHTDTSGVVPSTSKIYLGSRENGSTTYYSSNPIKVARIYNTRLSNSELAALTQV